MNIKEKIQRVRKNHWLMMIICCATPLIIAGIFYYFGLKTYAFFALVLLCPILHYFMMKDMHGKHECHENEKDKKKEK